jgi:hypothetical protein
LPELADMLMQLVHETRLVAVSDAMRAKSDAKSAGAKKNLKEIAKRWLQYEAGAVDGTTHSKNTAAPLLSAQFRLSEGRIRKVYLTNIETNLDAFPFGVDAARRELGLIP